MAPLKRLLPLLVGLLLGGLIASIFVGTSGGNPADARVADRAAVMQVVQHGREVPIVTAWMKAFNTGTYEDVRALFTKDGVLTTAADTHYSVYRNIRFEPGQRVDGAEFQRRIEMHLGDSQRVLGTPIQVGRNSVAFGWAFGGTGVRGTALLHLRNGKIVIAIVGPSQLDGKNFEIPFGGG